MTSLLEPPCYLCPLPRSSLLFTTLPEAPTVTFSLLFSYLFFTTLGEAPKLERSSLSGAARTVLVRDKQIVRPQFITLDLATHHVYWADSYLERIERVQYDGNDRTLIVRRYWVENINGLVLFERALYVSSQRNSTVARLPVHDDITETKQLLMEGLKRPGGVGIMHRQRQPTGTCTSTTDINQLIITCSKTFPYHHLPNKE